jgi:limonene-1,2-epoxide hydrolase
MSTAKSTPIAVVRAWIRALECGDADALVALTSPRLEYTRWSGVERGHDAVRGLVERQGYGVSGQPTLLRAFGRDDTVVAEVRMEGRYVDTGELAGVEQAAALFVVQEGRVAHLERYRELAAALAAAGLSEDDEIVPPRRAALSRLARRIGEGMQHAPVWLWAAPLAPWPFPGRRWPR